MLPLILPYMDTNIVTFSVSDLRHDTTKVLKETLNRGFAYLLRHSKPEFALVDINYLQSLREAYEDYLDMLEFDKTVNLKKAPLGAHKSKFIGNK